ncbi:MAG: PilT/PilU family type 4a pilus ATPase [Methylicorpusculum sp.]|uniref:PilT/PilU family type 4a pilus ATPase n=1 Tax=Methylicorpusculum sp. TaxID=2713644 RepID=UPI00271AA8F6|nr:PilT/PilU family type 4a pilus ATPase [Methylicorpusculum sp.]MDO8844342.1 PilT/PilU family type 4a pilus ATPase [Methylicorpusculum sp.]MDO8940697.1 PilT/PilU family type 4a pilus ATPase [Methylicorpusculum sp.]MDO9241940.1 PilT/PilU family type 4a pilus ATPase [Methylicorpusculum sp.]MDP2178351.1 PilT/PilU family type 4a pilus ATPase [Methylicorpusculum sp.]MDP2202674.1 PilT/PilU family type 4a pilus ATPase [Methylicorpusculum sp.]
MDFKPLLEIMVQQKASDLFITTGRPPTIKVDGKLIELSKSKLNPQQTEAIVTGIMNQRQKDEFENTKECQFAISYTDLGRFRVSAYTQRDSPGMVLRRIETHIPDAEELNLPPILKSLVMNKRGLVLFVGGTGTGKSSSLASLIKYRNQNTSGHIITIEDPLEFMHPHLGCIVTQREVGMDTESYEVALKNTLRQAPDVILIGEVRTRETMQQAITFAETGHLCLTTLHANNANQAIDRILHFFPDEMHGQLFMDLSMNLRGIVAQQLIARADGKGRYPAVEILINTPLVSDYIRKGEVHKLKELMKTSREQGMQTFDQALYDLYVAGKISYEDALNSADSRNEVRLMIKLGAESLAGGSEMNLQEEDDLNRLY